jgi:hypothetical protein
MSQFAYFRARSCRELQLGQLNGTVASFPISGVLSTEAGKHYSHFASSTGVAVSPVGRHIWSEGFSAPASRRGFIVATLELVARFQGFAPLF